VPPKSLNLLIDEFIERDIRDWIEAKECEAEQLDFNLEPEQA
jgi:hypothetical protein